MTRPELVLFDLDGTLLDGAGLPEAMRATCAVLAARLQHVSVDELVTANTAAWQRLWPELEDDYFLGSRAGDEIVEQAWAATLLACGSDDPALLATAVRDWEHQQRLSFHLFEDALPALDALVSTGLRIGMVTNGASWVQRLKLETVGLLDRLDPLVISGDVGMRKPEREIFEVALHRAGVAPGAAWFVGDNLWHDIAPAADAGLRTAWIDRHGTDLDPSWPQPDAVLRSLGDLPDVVAAAAQEPR